MHNAVSMQIEIALNNWLSRWGVMAFFIVVPNACFAQGTAQLSFPFALPKHEWKVERFEKLVRVNENESYVFRDVSEKKNLIIKRNWDKDITIAWHDDEMKDILIIEDNLGAQRIYKYEANKSNFPKGVLEFSKYIGMDAPSPYDEVMDLYKK
jgi:hypothetical protein